MNVDPSEILRFCTTHYKAKGTTPFSTEGREWVEHELVRPLLSWRYWAQDPETLCNDCRARVMQLTEWSPAEVKRLRDAKCCSGLQLVPIMLLVLNLQRGAGKTCNVSAVILALMWFVPRLTVAFVASAGKQTKMLVDENYLRPIAARPALNKKYTNKYDKITCKRPGGAHSYLEFTDTSHGSITGRRRDIIFVDEGRDVEARTFAALVPSVKAQSKFVCPAGHAIEPYREQVTPKCPACGDYMVPRIPKIVVTSTSGVLSGDEHDWFMELVTELERSPSPYAHLYRDDDAPNPAVSATEQDMLQRTFAEVPSLRTYMDVELHNVPRRKGEDFVSAGDIDGVLDPALANLTGSPRRCFGYLDTSRTGDVTSLVINATDDERSEELWQFVRTDHIAIWDPKDRRQCPRGYIERAQVEAHILQHVPRFPALAELMVDVRGGRHKAWAIDMITDLKKGHCSPEAAALLGLQQGDADGIARAIGPKLVAHAYGQEVERDTAYMHLEQRILSRTWRAPAHPRIRSELLGVRRVLRVDGSIEVKDRNRKVRHADLIDGIAWTFKRIYEEMTRPRASLADVNRPNVVNAVRRLLPMSRSFTQGLSVSDV